MPPPTPTGDFFIVAGATASGKSEIAVRIAERCNGEIVGADAFQIYAGLERLTAQPSPEFRARVPHHLVGEIPPDQRFDVAQYLALAASRIAEIRARGRRVIVCGGTGLFLRALTRGLAELPPADAEIRARLEAQTAAEREQQLASLDPVAHSQIDLKNPRRVIRALEVCLLTGKPFSSFRSEWAGETRSAGVVLVRDRESLHARIAARTAAMFRAGVVEEVAACREAGSTARQAIGFQQIGELLAGRISRDRCIELIEAATRQYAKRQMTWFRREPGLTPLELISDEPSEATLRDLTERATG
jgi:tRNA dimethylallyltransferase